MLPDDSTIPDEAARRIRAEAANLLERADARGRFPTPVGDILTSANLSLADDDFLRPSFLRRLRAKAGDALKSALGKLLGLFDVRERLVFVDRTLNIVKQRFIQLHETAHGFLPWQRELYAVVEETASTIAPDVADRFDREANVFATNVLFQIDSFAADAAEHPFGITTPLKVGRKYGASAYASIRQYVRTSGKASIVLVLNPPETLNDPVGRPGMVASLRRVEASPEFISAFGNVEWPHTFTPNDLIGRMIPYGRRRMSGKRTIPLEDRNGTRHECIAEAFNSTWQVFILIIPRKELTATTVLLSA